MMLSRSPPSRFELLAYVTLALGVFSDQLSTSIALSRENISETNPVALGLMQKGIWTLTDVFLILTSIAVSFILLRIMKSPMARTILVFPFMVGLLRFAVTIWNLSLLI
jgi:preprotein translocase subunit Sec63